MFSKKTLQQRNFTSRNNFQIFWGHPGDYNKSLKDVFIPTILQHSDDCAKLHMQNVRVLIYNTIQLYILSSQRPFRFSYI